MILQKYYINYKLEKKVKLWEEIALCWSIKNLSKIKRVWLNLNKRNLAKMDEFYVLTDIFEKRENVSKSSVFMKKKIKTV